MKTDAVVTRPIRAEENSRQIILRTRGHSHGGVSRLVSPGDIGELIKAVRLQIKRGSDVIKSCVFNMNIIN